MLKNGEYIYQTFAKLLFLAAVFLGQVSTGFNLLTIKSPWNEHLNYLFDQNFQQFNNFDSCKQKAKIENKTLLLEHPKKIQFSRIFIFTPF